MQAICYETVEKKKSLELYCQAYNGTQMLDQ